MLYIYRRIHAITWKTSQTYIMENLGVYDASTEMSRADLHANDVVC